VVAVVAGALLVLMGVMVYASVFLMLWGTEPAE